MGNILEFFSRCVLSKMIGLSMTSEHDKLSHHTENMTSLSRNVTVFTAFKTISVNFSKRVLILSRVKNYSENLICGNYVNVNQTSSNSRLPCKLRASL